jgi:hypothetical protein
MKKNCISVIFVLFILIASFASAADLKTKELLVENASLRVKLIECLINDIGTRIDLIQFKIDFNSILGQTSNNIQKKKSDINSLNSLNREKDDLVNLLKKAKKVLSETKSMPID